MTARRCERCRARRWPATCRTRRSSRSDVAPQPITEQSIGEFLRCSMGLSAWKQSGPVALGAPRQSVERQPASDRSAGSSSRTRRVVPLRAARARARASAACFDVGRRRRAAPDDDYFLVGLTSIIWREAWKYGERAFRYCQHDAGHAIGALRFAAAMLGWRMQLLPDWSDARIAALLGLDRDADFEGAEREEPECVRWSSCRDRRIGDPALEPQALVERGPQRVVVRPRQSSESRSRRLADHRRGDAATRYSGHLGSRDSRIAPKNSTPPDHRTTVPSSPPDRPPTARDIILQRRSALAFRSARRAAARFVSCHARAVCGRARRRGTRIDWPPHVHLALFVHRVQDVTPGIYAYLRDDTGCVERMESRDAPRVSLGRRVADDGWPFSPARADRSRPHRQPAVVRSGHRRRGFFGLGMIARVRAAAARARRVVLPPAVLGMRPHRPGVVSRSRSGRRPRNTASAATTTTPCTTLLGLSGHEWQSLYHFSMGLPVEDTRLTTEPGYEWEN